MKTQNSTNLNQSDLSSEQHEIVSRLHQFDMSFVLDKLVMDKKISPSSTLMLEREFKRFIALAGFGIWPLAMIGPRVDEVWHQFVLFTKRYKEFCLKTVGSFIDHQPNTRVTPIPLVAIENFRSSYHHYFGQIPDIWFEGMTKETKCYYLQPVLSGNPPSAWSGWAGPE